MKVSAHQRRNLRGFTLVELLLVMGIIGIISSISILSLISFQQRQRLVNAAREVYSSINLAKSRAQSQLKPPGCVDTLNGYRVYIYTNSYEVFARCGSTNITFGGLKRLPTNVTFSDISSGSYFQFNTLSGTVPRADINGTPFRVFSSGTNFMIITVFRDGRVTLSE